MRGSLLDVIRLEKILLTIYTQYQPAVLIFSFIFLNISPLSSYFPFPYIVSHTYSLLPLGHIHHAMKSLSMI